MTKRIKAQKPLRDSLASHHTAPEEEVVTFAKRVQEFVEGGDLAHYAGTQPGNRLSLEQVVHFLTQSCQALHEAEELEIIHRDLKPTNLLIDHRNNIKIATARGRRIITRSLTLFR